MKRSVCRDAESALLLFITSLICFLGIGWMLNLKARPREHVEAQAAATSTPFQPYTEQSVTFPTFSRPDPLSVDTMSIPDHSSVLTSVDELPFSPHTLNILLTGSDTRPGFPGSRTDTIMILSLNMDSGEINLLSIPRDLYVYIPDSGNARINTAEGKGGTLLLADTILSNLGILTHNYIRINFEGFIKIVDDLHGIDVMNEHLILDTCDMKPVEFPSGSIHLDGTSALCFARVRKSTSDFDRMRRQQQIIEAVFNRVISIHGLTSIPDLYNGYVEYVDTDLNLNAVLQLLPLAFHAVNHPEIIHFHTISRDYVQGYTVPESGAQVLLPDQQSIRSLLEEIFSGP